MARTSTTTMFTIAALLLVASANPSLAQQRKTRTFPADKGPATVDVSRYSPLVKTNYRVFAQKCATCHTLARPINTNKNAFAWRLYVDRMKKKPNANISEAQSIQIFQFLKFYQAEKDKAKTPRHP